MSHASLFRSASVCSAALLLAGCAITNTGAVDYRRAGAAVLAAEPCVPTNANGPNLRECPPYAAAPLYLKNFPTGSEITSDNAYSVSLDHALITDMIEAKFSQRRLLQAKNPFRTTGEIVILANALEFPDAGKDKRFFDFSDFSKAKVVYYNPDVQEGQSLNLSNIPIVPPTRYGGRPIGMQIVILELDRTNAPTKALLTRLAALGQATGVVPGGAVAETLLSIGQSMLLNDHDDVNFEYRFVLDPVNAVSSIPSAPFEEGRYVIRRHENRTTLPVWRNLRVDNNTGQLFVSDANQGWQNFTEDTYLTLLIKKHPLSAVSSEDVLRTKEDLEREISAIASSDGPIGKPQQEALDQLVTRSKASAASQSNIETVGAIARAGSLYARTVTRDGQTCPRSELRRQSAQNLTSLRIVIETFRRKFGEHAAILSEDQKSDLMQSLSAVVAPYPTGSIFTPVSLSQSGSFAALVGDPTFTDAMVGAIVANHGLAACPA